MSGIQMRGDSLCLRCGALSASQTRGNSLPLRCWQEVRWSHSHCLAKPQRFIALGKAWLTPFMRSASVVKFLPDSIYVKTIWNSRENTLLGSSLRAACIKEIWSVCNSSVSALPTSSSRWERLSFPTLVKRWDLVGLLELMTKRSTGLPSRWIEGSQLSLRPLSTDVCFPLCGLRGFSAAKTNYIIELCLRFMCMYKLYSMVFVPFCNGACLLFKLGKLLIHFLFDRTKPRSSVYYYSWHLKVTLILIKHKL